jgi:rubrerythrin
MNDKAMVAKLSSLAQLDIDAAYTYEQAMKVQENMDILRALESFQNDHLRHVEELSALIQQFGGDAPKLERDIKGVVLEGMTRIAGFVGKEGALAAMMSNETLTNYAYKSALSIKDLPADVRALLERNQTDETRHFDYITSALKGDVRKAVSNIGGRIAGRSGQESIA